MLARLDEWLVSADDTRWVFVTGGPGMGKSAILATWLDRHETTGAMAPSRVRRRLLRQLATLLTRRQVPTTWVAHHFISRQAGPRPEVIRARRTAHHLGPSAELHCDRITANTGCTGTCLTASVFIVFSPTRVLYGTVMGENASRPTVCVSAERAPRSSTAAELVTEHGAQRAPQLAFLGDIVVEPRLLSSDRGRRSTMANSVAEPGQE